MKAMEWKQNQTILFIGDSITDAQRRELPFRPLGQGYVNFAGHLLFARHPELDLRIENRGVSGDTTRELKARWQTDCLTLRPDVLSVMIGINDLWRNFKPVDEIDKTHVPAEEYKRNLRWLLEEAVSCCGCRLVLMERFISVATGKIRCAGSWMPIWMQFAPWRANIRRCWCRCSRPMKS